MAEIPDKTVRQTSGMGVPTRTRDIFSSTPVEVQSTHTEELVIALCGPIGSPLHTVGGLLKRVLEQEYNYQCEVIQLSRLIEEYRGKAPSEPRFDRIKGLIDKGNDIRKEFGSSVLADIAISKIAAHREQQKSESGSKRFEPRRVCHIVDSIKNQEELEALRLVYRDMLYFIGVFSPMPLREDALTGSGMTLSEVYQLIDRDSGEEIEHGQTVRNTFPHADCFIRIDSDAEKPIEDKLRRLLNVIFATEIVTPSPAERAMYAAASAAGNSACLSRQVGAALTDRDGEIIAIGWNDVPKVNGGLYHFDPSMNPRDDYRCMNKGGGICSNDVEKELIAKEIARELVRANLLQEQQIEQASSTIRKSKVKDLIEFSRSVHAEMHAIVLGSQLAGNRVRGGRLFCTTYPCHSCARHIILAGIKEVYYIEPYRKSLAIKLHGDAITETESEINKVRILPFDGIAPGRYLELFRMREDSRKIGSSGQMHPTNKKNAVPKCAVTLESLPVLEGIVVQRLISSKVIKRIGETVQPSVKEKSDERK
ncbi:MAG: anti-phage dCTP deaminase [Acidobacteriaceae bacterium]